MIAPDLTHTQVELVHGRAAVEVDEIYDENNLDVVVDGVSTQLVKRGYYEFDAAPATARVFDGKAAIEIGDGKYKVIKAHHEVALASGQNASAPLLKPASFNTDDARDDFYNWNSLRSQYLAEANNQIATEYEGGPGFAAGWYWNPYAGITRTSVPVPSGARLAGATTPMDGVVGGAAGMAATAIAAANTTAQATRMAEPMLAL